MGAVWRVFLYHFLGVSNSDSGIRSRERECLVYGVICNMFLYYFLEIRLMNLLQIPMWAVDLCKFG